jgi:hypothetical protein
MDFGTKEEWFGPEILERHLESAKDEDWRRGVIDQAEKLFGLWRWENQELDPALITGLVLATWVQTVWDWRPLVSITGDTNTGKSLLFEALGGTLGRRGIFGPLSFRQSKSTEAGIRQGVKNTAKAILSDEFEQSRDRDKILELFRASTRGEAVARGTADQQGRQFTLRHIAWIAAVETGLQRQPDLNRFIQLELLPAEEGREGMLLLPDGAILHELGQKLLAIAVRFAVQAKQLASQLKNLQLDGIDARAVESYAVPTSILALAVEYSDKQAKTLLVDLLGNVDMDEQGQSDHANLISDILESTIFCSSSIGHRAVWQILESPSLYYEHSEQLAAAGIRQLEKTGEIFIAVRKVERTLLRDTNWRGQKLSQILKRAPGARYCPQRVAGKLTKGVALKLEECYSPKGNKLEDE